MKDSEEVKEVNQSLNEIDKKTELSVQQFFVMFVLLTC